MRTRVHPCENVHTCPQEAWREQHAAAARQRNSMLKRPASPATHSALRAQAKAAATAAKQAAQATAAAAKAAHACQAALAAHPTRTPCQATAASQHLGHAQDLATCAQLVYAAEPLKRALALELCKCEGEAAGPLGPYKLDGPRVGTMLQRCVVWRWAG